MASLEDDEVSLDGAASEHSGEGGGEDAKKEDDSAPLLHNQDVPLKDIINPIDTDVLCGRGGAALRHPGNQTYRRLVHLNKGLYITCLKAEKLKISKSIVAAIREQNGRFLEKDKNGLFFDIGDKKAMEKTSQALREGQPKLRQKIVELGGGAAGAAALLEHQFNCTAPTSVYSSPGYDNYGTPLESSFGVPCEFTSSSGNLHHNTTSHPHSTSNTNINSTQHVMNHNTVSLSAAVSAAPASNAKEDCSISNAAAVGPATATAAISANNANAQVSPNDMLSRMTLEEHKESSFPHNRTSLTQRGSAAAQALGVDESTLSFMSNLGAYGNTDHTTIMEQAHAQLLTQTQPITVAAAAAAGADSQQHLNNNNYFGDSLAQEEKEKDHGEFRAVHQTVAAAVQSSSKSNNISSNKHTNRNSNINSSSGKKQDRRHMFAMMKCRAPNRGSQRSLGQSQRSLGVDGMPDIHFVESGRSLMSNMSCSTPGEGGDSSHENDNNNLGQPQQRKRVPTVADVFGGSRRSLMSGLSKISDDSEANSMFSDLSKQIGNVSTHLSTRSLLSDMSGIGELELSDLESFSGATSNAREIPTPTPTISSDMYIE